MQTNQSTKVHLAYNLSSDSTSYTEGSKSPSELTIALAGNANVGKSAIFNQLTGLNQVTGNWPGKTVERAEGTLHFKGYNIRIVDLPGTYSLSAYSMEEIVSREYLAVEKPDLIINVVDASVLERNLYLTLQLLELQVPFVMALNQMDFAAKKGLRIDIEKLSEVLGVRVVPTVATTGTGITELLDAVIDQVYKPNKVTVDEAHLRKRNRTKNPSNRKPRGYQPFSVLQSLPSQMDCYKATGERPGHREQSRSHSRRKSHVGTR